MGEIAQMQVSQKGVLIKEDKVLIVKTSYLKDFWDLPGGRVDVGEFADQAFRREMKEELGLREFKNLGVVDYDVWRLNDGKMFCGITNLIEGSGEIILSSEHEDFAWVREGDLEQFKFLWGTDYLDRMPNMIRKAFQMRQMF